MRFYPVPHPVPTELRTAVFLLRPLTPAHVQLDYDALMASKKMLRLWSGSSWPSDDFTLADNLKDLARHDDEHQNRIAFTYTILNPNETSCLGCLYINPLKIIEANNPGLVTAVSPTDALIRFWIRKDQLKNKLDYQLLQILIPWFETTWNFNRVCIHTHQANQQQHRLFSTLPRVGTCQIPHRGGTHILYSP